jgi:uncharacterized ion transporter superfamily protein YfcC
LNKEVKKVSHKKQIKVPHTYVILFTVILIMSILTYIIPAGVYDRITEAVTRRVLVDPASFHGVEQNPTRFFVSNLSPRE